MNIAEHTKTLDLERVFNASPERLYQAWTTPEQIEKWWGCAQTKSTRAELDLKVGGSIKFEMNIGEPQSMIITGEYKEVIKNEKLVFTLIFHGPPEEDPDLTEVTVEFEALNAKQTKMKLTHRGLSSEFIERADEGWGTALDKLEKLF